MAILITGGMGYIGSHAVVELLEKSEEIIIVDNLSNSQISKLDLLEKITGKKPTFYEVDINDKEGLNKIFNNHKIESVIHFAALKAVGESVEKPLKYYENNVTGTLTLLEIMKEHNVKRIVFSSSAAVYGIPSKVPITEDMPTSATNPYGTTKIMIEQVLKDLYASDDEWGISILRYFNVIGAHDSTLIGDIPNGIPSNIMPYITKVATGKLKQLSVFGDDYKTHDGTGVRDYIHVVDLVKGHIKALDKLRIDKSGLLIHNLGTGTGYSVLDLVNAFEKENDIKINYTIASRRPGDIDACYADPSKSKNELNWQAEKTIEDMCRDAWNFENNLK